ncbi:LysR family transcriptional regulator [Paraburkholderia saeva]|uniref:PCP degradation transcriptional activation protein n=1 Tax=Paraburkholderia saeva TaxID=2777537 RepID=A0A9N8X1X2_9BURK|nr:LysR family transcriptional regulator [Paraburkholderia saeva]CAG4897235.1 PCP degradation transcriptional activation protein [Paraburkholderia saeva]CAG4920007.1 PCP degradation transcriptional activation protein [Paraburkholderia saeva]
MQTEPNSNPNGQDVLLPPDGDDVPRVQDLDLNLLKAFHAVYVEKNVGRAALRLGMTQPSVSHALSRLRLVFRDALFVRTPGGVEATPRAQRLAGSIDRVLRILQDMLDEGAQFCAATSRRVFRLHMSDFAESAFLPTLMRELDTRAPGVVIETHHIEDSQFNMAIESGRIDFALGHFPHASSHFHFSELLQERYVLLMARRVARRLELDEHFTLGLNAPDGLHFIAVTSHPQATELLERYGLTSRVRLAVPNFMVVPAILSRCDYALIVPHTVARAFSTPGDSAMFEIDDASTWPVNAYWHRRFDADPGHRWLRGLLMELFRIGAREPFDSWLGAPLDLAPDSAHNA